MVDITVIVTAHDETLVAGPTMQSAKVAICSAEDHGFSIEKIIALDAATDDCRGYFHQKAFSHWEIAEFDFSDPFQTRNAAVEMATGRWIAFVDADDLISENWLLKAARRLTEAEDLGEKIIAHPEINWTFEGANLISVKPHQHEPYFSPHYFYFTNYYSMLAMAPRAAIIETPYGNRDVPNGFGYQDWQWNIETMAKGWCHVSVRDTIIFVRRRAMSVSAENRRNNALLRSLEPMAVDRVRNLNISGQPLCPGMQKSAGNRNEK